MCGLRLLFPSVLRHVRPFEAPRPEGPLCFLTEQECLL